MPHTHRMLLPLLLAWGLTHCAPSLSEPPPSVALEEATAET